MLINDKFGRVIDSKAVRVVTVDHKPMTTRWQVVAHLYEPIILGSECRKAEALILTDDCEHEAEAMRIAKLLSHYWNNDSKVVVDIREKLVKDIFGFREWCGIPFDELVCE